MMPPSAKGIASQPQTLDLPILKDLDERAGAQFVERYARAFCSFFFCNGSAVDCTQKVVQEALAGGGVVKNIADKRRLRGFFDEVPETFGRGVEAFKKKCKDGGIPRRQLCRVKIPALIECIRERMTAVVVVQLPCPMNGSRVFDHLLVRKIVAAMRSDRHNVGCAVRKPNAGAAK